MKDVRLYPQSRIENFQAKKSAIVIESHCRIKGQLLVYGHSGRIKIGQYSFIGEGSYIWSSSSVTIGNRVLISHGVNIHDGNAHSLSAENRHKHFYDIITSGMPSVLEDVEDEPIIIQDDVWIGFNSTILKGVTIGHGAIIGACSLVMKNVAPYTIVAGNPCEVLGNARK
ncbi:MAG: acyltransferase [Firmicutes bacterium]|nr:acyltransferase [Bacillota bacterium]